MNVTRRRVTGVSHGERSLTTRRSRLVLAGLASLALASTGVAYGSTAGFGSNHVGDQTAAGLQVSDDQVINPLGDRLMTPFGKMMGSSVSPDGRFLAASSADRSFDVQVFDLASYKPIAAAGTASVASATTAITKAGFTGLQYQKIGNGTVGQEGPVYSPDGKWLWLSQQDALTRFPVNADGTLGTPTSYPLAKVNGLSALPGKPAFSADG
ncbi:MAG TPA: phosphoesterase, partial [Nocardioides sp.]|nr:phosphoesterase [Nocardioides sp.]